MAKKKLTLQPKAEGILSAEPVRLGYYSGFLESDPRQINVREERGGWAAYAGGDTVPVTPGSRLTDPPGTFATKAEAEAAAVEYLKRRPA